MKVHVPEYGTLIGDPVAIVKMLEDARMFDHPTGDDYIDEIVHTAWRAFNIGLHVTGDTYAERAESLLREMDKNHMINIEED